jgi:ABC-type transport system involved in Fe-S cluster assembly fused permease/ATPase subunit
VIDRGTGSMRVLLETMLFSIGPALIDVVGAAILLTTKEAWMSVIILVSVAFYVPITIVITEHRGKLRRELNTLDNKVGGKVPLVPHRPPFFAVPCR